MCSLALLLGAPFVLWAQEAATAVGTRPPFSIGASLHRGSIIAHSKKLVDVSTSSPYGVKADLSWLLADERYTRRCGLIARRGIELSAIDFDDPEVLGRMYGLLPYIEPMIRGQDRLHGSIRLGLGFAWLTRVYDEESNPTNLFFSTHFTFAGLVAARVGYRLTPKWEMLVAYNFNHLSNGGMKEPNKGMNYPTWSLGLSCTPQPMIIPRPVRDDQWRLQPRRSTTAMLSASLKTAAATDSAAAQRCWLLGALGTLSWRTGRLTAVAAGTEWVHDGFTREQFDRAGSSLSAWKGALLAGPELLSGRVRFSLLFGVYLVNPLPRTDAVYQRYQLTYTVGRHLLVGTSLKAHRHVADVFDLRMGWTW